MAIFRDRLPSRHDLIYGFAACAFPIYLWSIVNLLRNVPAWILRLSVWELLGAAAYTQALTLLESLALLILFVGISVALPPKIYRNKFVPLTAMIALVTATWAAALHSAKLWELKRLPLWIFVYFALILICFILIHRFARLEKAISGGVQRLSPLAFVYVLLSIAGVIIVLLRNI